MKKTRLENLFPVTEAFLGSYSYLLQTREILVAQVFQLSTDSPLFHRGLRCHTSEQSPAHKDAWLDLSRPGRTPSLVSAIPHRVLRHTQSCQQALSPSDWECLQRCQQCLMRR